MEQARHPRPVESTRQLLSTHLSEPALQPLEEPVLLVTFPDDADRVPGVADNLGTLVLVQLLGNVDGDVRKLEKGALGRDATAVQGLPPDLAGLLPRVPAKADGREVECLVGNAAEYVHAALVLFGLVVARKVVRLRILTLESRTIVLAML